MKKRINTPRVTAIYGELSRGFVHPSAFVFDSAGKYRGTLVVAGEGRTKREKEDEALLDTILADMAFSEAGAK